MEDLDIPKLSNLLNNDPTIIKHWRKLYDGLKLPGASAVTLAKFLDIGKITSYELFIEILESWKSLKGKGATSKNLENALKNSGFQDAADKVKEHRSSQKSSVESYGIPIGTLEFPANFNVEQVSQVDVSRTDLENEIEAYLTSGPCFTSRIGPVVVLHGNEGMGKTSLARKICQITKDFFQENCIWIKAKREKFIIKDFAKLFGLTDKMLGSVLPSLHQSYRTQFKDHKCLLVFDNVNNFKEILPYLPIDISTMISVLITSKSMWETEDYGEIKHIRVDKFTTTEIAELAKKIIPNISESEIKILDNYTGRIPYLANTFFIGLSNWKKCHPKGNINEGLGLREDDILIGGSNLDMQLLGCKKSPIEIVEQHINLILKYDEDAIKLLYILAYCKSELEEVALLDANKMKQEFSLANPTSAIDTLIREGFLKRNIKRGTLGNYTELSMHHCHQKIIQIILRQQGREKQEIERIFLVDFSTAQCWNFPLVWKLATEYKGAILENLINNPDFLSGLVKNEVKNGPLFPIKCPDGFLHLAACYKKTKSKKEFARWILFGDPGLGLTLLGNEMRQFMTEIVDDFEELVEEMKLYKGDDKQNKLLHLGLLAFDKKTWLKQFFTTFPKILRASVGHDGSSLLHIAARDGKLAGTEYFIEKGFNVDDQNDQGETPLHKAASCGNVKIIETLLKAGSNPNMQDIWKTTPLHRAVAGKHVEVVKVLLSFNVDQKIREVNGEKALDIAKSKGYTEIIQLFTK